MVGAALSLSPVRTGCPVRGGLLTITDKCRSCGLGFAGQDAGDGLAVFFIFILGFLVFGLAISLKRAFAPTLWVHGALWTPLVLGGSIGMLKPLKGMNVALQYRFRP